MKSDHRAAHSPWKTTAVRRIVIALAIVITAAFALRFHSRAADAVPTFTQTNLVSDATAVTAKTTDPNLVNPWGMALGINSGIWVSDEGSGKATTYDGAGKIISTGAGFNVTIPGTAAGTPAHPSGIATNGTTGFVISSGGKSGASTELFATLDGTIAGWSPKVDPDNAVIAVNNSPAGASYTGLAIAFNNSGAFLFAANFPAGTVDVFDSKFQPVHTPNDFRDPDLPDGYAPFGIAAINSNLYVTFALQSSQNKKFDSPGPGRGFVDIFTTDGKLVKRFTSQGPLNAPWGMAWAPFEGFGKFDNALFVGNFGDGTINAFDFDTGESLGALVDSNKKPIVNPGLWALQFGLGVANGSSSALYFNAGIGNEKHGLIGMLKVDPSSVTPPGAPTMVDSSLTVSTVVSKLDQPTSMAFLADGDFLVLEKASGKVQHVVNGTVVNTALDLAVNSASERGLLGIALDPNFSQNHFVYLYWTESSTGNDSSDLAAVPLLGNRVDRYTWNPSTETLGSQQNLIKLHAFQADANQPMRGNHDGGKILFGPDGKLYFQIGDNGRRGQLQNLPNGPFGNGQPDDQFGGPAPDNAHLTGAIFRLNPDGTTPDDNPFAKITMEQLVKLEQDAGVSSTVFGQLPEIMANIRKVFSYGRRNGFGLAFDPQTGFLWESENGDDAMDEMNHITAGSNGGWIQIMGPMSKVKTFKRIEASFTPLQGNLPVAGNLPLSAIDPTTFIPALQQVRWPPTLIADSPGHARKRLFVLPGSHYEDPEFAWRWAVAPAAIGFAGAGLGSQHAGNLFVGASRTFLDEGYLFEFKFDQKRQHFAFSDPKLEDRLDNNDYKFDEGQSTSLLAGRNFGIVTNIVTGPDGNLYVTSLSNGSVYVIK